jgi:iron complex outermembrane receptor protein
VTQAPGDAPVRARRPVQALVLPGRTVAGGANTGPDGRYRIGALAPVRTRWSSRASATSLQRVDSLRVAEGQTVTANVTITELASTLDQVVVTSSRAPEKVLDAPASISVVSAAQIERRPAVTVVDQVRNTPGRRRHAGRPRAVERGRARLQQRVLGQPAHAAGLPLRGRAVAARERAVPLHGTNEDVERIEVLLGPAAALYGPTRRTA